jgi:ParB family chromosome partitioning protein
MSDNAVNPKNRGLGRGLDAIFGEDVSRETTEIDIDITTEETAVIQGQRNSIPIEWLQACSFQPRKNFDKDALEDLAKSIAMHGILQPIVVRPIEDRNNEYEIIAGERRWRAAQLVQLHEVPVNIQYLDNEAVLEIALIENLQREDLTPIEEAVALQKLMDDHGHTQEKLSIAIGKSRSYIANALRLLTLPETVQTMVNKGELSAGHARALVGQDNAEIIAKQILSDNMSVRDIERLMKDSRNKKSNNSKASKPEKDVNTIALEDEISRILGMRVTIQSSGKGKGTLKIDYTSFDQLDDVIHRLSKS